MASKSEIDIKVNAVKTTRILDLSALALSTIPRSVTKAIDQNITQKLILRRNRITQLGEEVLELGTDIKEIDAGRNNISSLGEQLTKITGLEALNLSENRLCGELPSFICTGFPNLTKLDLSGNSLVKIPIEICKMTSLKYLNLSHNKLETLPLGLCDLTKLEVLIISRNELRELPIEIGRLSSLVRLDASENNIRSLPNSFKSLNSAKLSTLLLTGNPMVCPRASICERGRDAIFQEISRLESSKAVALRSSLSDLKECVCGNTLKFTVIAKDAEGARRINGGDAVLASLAGPSSITLNVNDNSDGSYTISSPIPLSIPGVYQLIVNINAVQLPETPISLRIWPAPADTVADIDALAPETPQESTNFIPDPSIKGYSALLKWCRELNVSLSVPEIVVCGCDGYEQLVESVWGIFPLDFPKDFHLKRPLVLNLVRSEELSSTPNEIRVTLRRDKLLGAGVSGGMRDTQLSISALREHIEARNKEFSSVPVVVQIESSSLIGCTITLAPALPTNENDPLLPSVELLLSKLLHESSAILIAMPCLPQELTRTSSWISRVLSVDPTLSHTAIAFTGFYNSLSASRTAEQLAQLGLGSGHNLSNSCFFLSLLTAPTRIACADSRDEFLKHLSRSDTRDLLAVSSIVGSTKLNIGSFSLRSYIRDLITKIYKTSLPPLRQCVEDNVKCYEKEVESIHEHLNSIKETKSLASILRSTTSSHSLSFCSIVDEVLHGTAQGRPTEQGLSLYEEYDKIIKRQNAIVSPTTYSSISLIGNANNKLYGGAQLVRCLDYFRQLINDAATRGIPSCVLSDASTSISAACEVAQKEARKALEPLVIQLCSHALLAVQNAADVAVTINSERNKKLNDKAKTKTLASRLTEFSYLERNVHDLFIEIAEGRIKAFREACNSDLPSPTAAAGIGLPVLSAEIVTSNGGLANVAVSLFRKLLLLAGDAISARFFSFLPKELIVSLPAEMHSALVSMEDRHLSNIFRLQALEDTLKQEETQASKQLADAKEKMAIVCAITL